MIGRLVGVGVGPGDPELVTVRALRVLRAADRVVAPSTAIDAVGRAESIVRQAAPDVTVDRLAFEMAPGRDARRQTAARAAETVAGWLADGETVAFITLGDPNVYSTFGAVAAEVRARCPSVTVDSVPGIMAFQELAARAGVHLLDDVESLALVTALDGPAQAESALADRSQAVVVYKGGRHLPAVAAAAARVGRLDDAVVGELLGLPGERIAPLAEVADRPATYLATIIVPPSGPQ